LASLWNNGEVEEQCIRYKRSRQGPYVSFNKPYAIQGLASSRAFLIADAE